MMTNLHAASLVLVTTGILAAQSLPDPALLSALEARAIGPAGMSGRVTAVSGVVKDPDILYVGAATGGLWKSTDGGMSFDPIMDDQPCASIGAIAIDQSRPDVVWIGTGEGNPRNSVSVGRGVFRSLDAGRTWQHLGLENTERIRRICLHPTDPDTAYVAALGTSWGENEERGVFMTTDGGATWTKVLFVDKKTGCANLVMDPENPRKLFANMWEHRRWPWFFRSGGPGSGLFRTLDGGRTWTRLGEKDGLPAGDLGRIGLGICRSKPHVVYALVEAKKSVLLRSDDGGMSFRTVNSEKGIASRPFYYGDIRVDPRDPDRVINMHTTVTVSEDGGKSFRTLIPYNEIHPDHHAMWIHPDRPQFIIDGNDGGVSISRDGGRSWRYASNLPLGQYYHIAVDMDLPYNVYGGMQDNGSWRGPSAVWENGGIRNHHWQEVCFGDGFDTLPHPEDSMIGYAMSQQGNLVRWNLRTGERKDIKPTGPDGVELRFNWNAGIAQDPFAANTIYYGSQFVHKSNDSGDNWTTISPDLTTNHAAWQKQDESGGLTYDVTGAENFTTILTIAASPVEEGILWVGTDDGRLHLTRDGGENWLSLEDRLPELPVHTWIPHIEASPHAAGTAFVVCDDHRRANWTSYVFATDDFGESWKNIATADVDGYCLSIAQDPGHEDLLFLGTEFGLFVSADAGTHWAKWSHGIPTVSAMDLVVHPRDHDLVIGTHGRAAFVLDDIRPLREVAKVAGEPLHLFPIPPAYQYRVKQTGPPRFAGATEFRGANKPRGVMITFWASGDDLAHPDEDVERQRTKARDGKKAETTKIQVSVADTEGTVLRTFKTPVQQGLNRFWWRFESNGRERPMRILRTEKEDADPPSGLPVPPGTYQVTLKLGAHEVQGEVEVLADPRVEIAAESRQEKWQAMKRAEGLSADLSALTDRVARAKDRIERVQAHLKSLPKEDRTEEIEALDEAAEKAVEAIKAFHDRVFGATGKQGIAGGDPLLRHVTRPMSSMRSSWDTPTSAQLDYLRRASETLEDITAQTDALFDGDLQEYDDALEAARLTFTVGR